MINEENLNKLYKGFLEGVELTTKQLNEYGFNSKDLNELIKRGSIERLRRGLYSFKSFDELFNYAFSMNEYDKATACFEKCYELDPNRSVVCFQLFLRCIKSKNYEKVFEYFEHIYDTNNKYYNTENNYYLYLLSMITELPEKHRNYVKFLKLEDIRVKVNDRRYNDISAQNHVRISSLNQKFLLAKKQLNDLIQAKGRSNFQDVVIKTLLNQAIEKQQERSKYISNLLHEKKFEELIEFLESFNEYHNLRTQDEYTLILTKDLTKMIKTGIIPEKQIVDTNNVFNAIKGKNYELALSLRKINFKNIGKEIDNDNLFFLLNEIKNFIDNKVITLEKNQASQEITPTVTEKQFVAEVSETTKTEYNTNILADIIEYLMKHDLDNSFLAIRDYLNSIKKNQYEFLIIDLIKISLLEKDITFSKSMNALILIEKENFEFNISEYIKNFYEVLSQNRFDIARIYLDIISKLSTLEQSSILIEGLEQVLNNTEKMLNYKQNDKISTKEEQSKQNNKDIPGFITEKSQYGDQASSITTEANSEQTKIEKISTKNIERNTNRTDIVSLKNKDYDDNKFIKKKLDTLYEKGILLLRPMDKERRKEIHEIVKKIPDVVSFSIDSGDKRQIVLRFKPYRGFIDLKKLLRVGKESYTRGDYDTCITSYRQVLEFGEPKSFVYAKLGLAYMKKNDKEAAIDYLTVATALSKKEKHDYDFGNLISNLKGEISYEDFKPEFEMSKENFDYNDINNFYGIENFDEINTYISESGLDVESACQQIGMKSEQIDIIKLIYAREFYVKGKLERGDLFLKSVERSKGKTKTTISLFEEVRKNRKFYQNRQVEVPRPLVLTLVPGKKKSLKV